MRDTSQPPRNAGSNKGVLLLLIGGTVILIIALIVLFKRRYEPKPAPEPPKVEQKFDAPPPLVIAQPTRPLALTPDGGLASAEKNKRRFREERIGSINTQEVNRFMNARYGQVKACYERRLKVNSFLEGKLDLNIDVSSVGRVTDISVNSDTLGDTQMLSCVKTAIRSWEFPKPKGGRVIIGKAFSFKKKGK